MAFPTYKLLNGVARNRAHPRTFHIPSDLEKAMIEPGDYVKLGFSCEGYDATERMWVRVVTNGAGVLDNDPAFLPLVCGQHILFDNKHILDILKKGDL